MLSFSGYSFIVVAVFSGSSQAISCPVNPESYIFENKHLLNYNESGCHVQNPYTTCSHPSILTDSDTQNGYLQWKQTDFLLLFTFPSEINLTSITLYYLDGKINNTETTYGLIGLTIDAVDDNFTLGSSPMEITTILKIDSHIGMEDPNTDLINTITSASYNITRPTVTRKVAIAPTDTRDGGLALSEMEFFDNADSCDSTPTSYGTKLQPAEVTSTASTTKANSNSPLVYVIPVVIVLLLCLIGFGLIVILLVILKHRKSVKDREQHTVPPSPLQMSPLTTAQVESLSSQTEGQEGGENPQDNSDAVDAMYAVVDKKKKKKQKESSSADQSDTVPDQSTNDAVDATYAVVDKKKIKSKNSLDVESHDPSQATYAVVDKSKKKKKEEEPLSDGDPPPAPEHTVDQLYATVQKQTKTKETPPEDNNDDEITVEHEKN